MHCVCVSLEKCLKKIQRLGPRDPITLSDDDWGVQSTPKRIVFRFHYHCQKVIGSLGRGIYDAP